MSPHKSEVNQITPNEIQRLLVTKTGADPAIFDNAGELSLEELGIDSLATLELQAVIEEDFGLQVPDDALAMSLTELVSHLNSQAQVNANSTGA
jgi:acyl carrier protein